MTKVKSNARRNGPVGLLQIVHNDAFSGPKLANFLVHLLRVGLALHTIGIYHSAISAFGNLSSQGFKSSYLMHLFYYGIPFMLTVWSIRCLM